MSRQTLQNDLASQLPEKGCWIEHRSFSDSDIPPVLYGEERGHGTPERWAEYRAKKLNENYCGSERTDLGVEAKAKRNTVYVYRNTEQRIYHSILKGEVQDSTNLRISENQFFDNKPKYSEKYGEYHSGLVVKISGDYNHELSSYHNQLVKIFKVIGPYHYLTRTEQREELKIRDTDVKSWVCTEVDGYNLLNKGKRRDLLQKFD